MRVLGPSQRSARARAPGASVSGSNRKCRSAKLAALQVKAATEERVAADLTKDPPPPSKQANRAQDFSYEYPGTSKSVLAIILGGGAGSRLFPLTKKRAKPAVPLGGNYRLIDIPISNCLHSNINKMYCLTQFNSASLNRHLSLAYNANIGSMTSKGFVEILAATQTPEKEMWFQGTADAVRQYMWLFEDSVKDGVEDYLILSGDHLYRCNYQDFLREHREKGADITVAALPCDPERASAFGLMKIDDTGKITSFAEKPTGDALKAMEVDTSILGLNKEKAKVMPHIASMGIYVVKASVMKELLLGTYPTANDFGSEIIPGAVKEGKRVQAYLFEGYWEDIGTIGAFYRSQLALLQPKPDFSFFDPHAPVFSMSRFLPPSRVNGCKIKQSMLGEGCYVEPGCKITNSIIGLRTKIGANCVIEDCLVMGCDFYETPEDCDTTESCVPMGIGANSTLRKCIVDKNARIAENVVLVNKNNESNNTDHADKGFIVKDGIIVIFKDGAVPAGFEY